MRFKKTVWTLLAIGLFTLDQWIKWHAIDPFCNPGIAFSLPLPGILTLLATGGFWIWIIAKHQTIFTNPPLLRQQIATTFLAAGSASNALDRLRLGCVVDYWQFWERSAINAADIMIVLGIILLLTKSKKSGENKNVSPR